jgi:hypothetical protein
VIARGLASRDLWTQLTEQKSLVVTDRWARKGLCNQKKSRAEEQQPFALFPEPVSTPVCEREDDQFPRKNPQQVYMAMTPSVLPLMGP